MVEFARTATGEARAALAFRGMDEGYRVAPEDLNAAARGVHDVLDALAELAHDRGWADQGRGTALVAGSAGPLGHAGLAAALDGFCTRWEWGVRAAVRTGREMADGLAGTARGYTEGDAAPAGLFGRLYADVTGDPGADPAGAEQRTWAELAAGAARPETAQERADAAASIGRTWADTARDLGENSTPGMVRTALDGGNPLQGQMDDLAALRGIAG